MLICTPSTIIAQSNSDSIVGGIVNGYIFDEAHNFCEGMAIVKYGGQYGYINNSGKLVVSFMFDECESFKNGFAKVKKKGKWGFVNKLGEIIVPPIYDDCFRFENGFSKVKQNGKFGFVNKEGKVVVPIQYDNAGEFSDGLASVKINGKWGYVDSLGRVVISPQYDCETLWGFEISSEFHNGYCIVSKYDNGITKALIDKNGRIVIPFYKSYVLWHIEDSCDGLIRAFQLVSENGMRTKKWGWVNFQGETVIPFKYEDTGFEFSEGLAAVKLNGKYGYIDKSGKTIIPFRFDEGYTFENGFAHVKLNNYEGYINKQGNEVVPLGKYKQCYVSSVTGGSFLFSAKLNEKYGVVDNHGKVIVPFIYDNIIYFYDDIARVDLNGKSGAIDRFGKIILPIKYEDMDYINSFSSGYAKVGLGYGYGYIDKSGKLLDIDVDADMCFKLGEELHSEKNFLGYSYSEKEKQQRRKAAFSWFKKGAMKDDIRCCYALGIYFRNGIFVEKNYSEAVKWLNKATKEQNGDVYRELGYCYDEGGYGIEKDEEKAFNYFLEGAKCHNQDCYYALAVCYLKGSGCIKDPKQACFYADKLYNIDSSKFAYIYASCYNLLAYVYAQEKDFPQAINAIDKAISIMNDSQNIVDFYDTKGEIYLMMGKEGEAVNMWKKVIEIKPDFLNSYPNGTELYNQLKSKGLI